MKGALGEKRMLVEPRSTKSLDQSKRIKDREWINDVETRRNDLDPREQKEKTTEKNPLPIQLKETHVPSSVNNLKKPGVTFVLVKASLHKGVVGKTTKILNADEHANSLLKQKKNLDNFRPDIVHNALLEIFGSPLCKAGMVQAIYVQIDNGVLFEIKPHVRIPRTIKRFNGLMLELLQKSYTKAKDTDEKLIRVIEQPVTRHLPKNSRIIGVSSSSKKVVNLHDFVVNISDDVNLVFVVGTMKNGTIDKLYTDEFISLSVCPSCPTEYVGQICDALEDKWKVV